MTRDLLAEMIAIYDVATLSQIIAEQVLGDVEVRNYLETCRSC